MGSESRGRVGKYPKICPVVADTLAAVGLLGGLVDGVLILWARMLDRAACRRQRHVELDHVDAAGAVAGREEAVVAVVDHPRRAAGRLVAASARVGAERAIVGVAADRVGERRHTGPGRHEVDRQPVVAGARLGDDFDQHGITVEVGRSLRPFFDVAKVLGLLPSVAQRGEAQEGAVSAAIAAAGQQHARVFEAQPGGRGDRDDG